MGIWTATMDRCSSFLGSMSCRHRFCRVIAHIQAQASEKNVCRESANRVAQTVNNETSLIMSSIAGHFVENTRRTQSRV